MKALPIKKSGFSLILFLALLMPGLTKAQETEGTIRYLAVHNWTKQMASLDYLSSQRKERISYMWGSRSEWKTYKTLHFTATASKYEDSEERAEPDDEGYSWRKALFFIKRDFAANTILDAIHIAGKDYLIQDSLRAPEWKVKNDLKEVAGHVCMNATLEDTLKNQTIIAWFALDLPVSAGPERFCGLPGLILEVDVNDGALVITADKIELKKLGTELDPPKKLKGKKITEAAYYELIKKQIKEKREMEEPWFWDLRY